MEYLKLKKGRSITLSTSNKFKLVKKLGGYSPCISLNLFNFELLPELRQKNIRSSLYLLLTNHPSRFKYLLFLLFYYEDTQKVLSEYGVGMAQTRTKATNPPTETASVVHCITSKDNNLHSLPMTVIRESSFEIRGVSLKKMWGVNR